MKKGKLFIPTLLFLLILASCQYDNAEDLYRSRSSINPADTTHNDTDTVCVTPKILLDIPFHGAIDDNGEDEIVVVGYGNPELTHDRFNQPGQALYLNGENQYLELDLGVQDSIAVSFWFNCASGRSNFSSLFDYGVNAVKTNIDGYSGATSFMVTAFYNNLDELNTDYYFQYYTWYHIYVSACSRPEIYVNGQKAGAVNRRIILNLTSTNLIIGKSVMETTANEVFFHGIIDDIKIFNYGLTAQEINELYSNGQVSLKDHPHETLE
ncbi:MAG: LamG-like jellyroll fold domain-containing protein [Bacteroidales bacterium]|jgi:hypothetical protein|nr:LamG-like jellyroll fold domain-containing protein [Bacteroidales bacterium]